MKNLEDVYLEARRGINIQENEKIILESKDLYYCYCFAWIIKEANIKAHEKVVLESKNSNYCYAFARYIKGSNKEELFKLVLESGDKYWINKFLEEVDFDKEKFVNYLLFI